MTYLQQGDCLFFKAKLPKNIEALKTNVVQEGEATGHAHRLDGDAFELFQEPETKVKYLRVVEPTMLRHEEHKAFEIPPGEYEVRIVKEYDHFSEEARSVAD